MVDFPFRYALQVRGQHQSQHHEHAHARTPVMASPLHGAWIWGLSLFESLGADYMHPTGQGPLWGHILGGPWGRPEAKRSLNFARALFLYELLSV